MPIATGETLKTQPLPAEFAALFRDHYGFVHRTAYRVTGNFADAEDVIQTLFLRLCGRELPPELSTNPRGYLYRAAVNIALDVIRTRKRHPAEGLTEKTAFLCETSVVLCVSVVNSESPACKHFQLSHADSELEWAKRKRSHSYDIVSGRFAAVDPLPSSLTSKR